MLRIESLFFYKRLLHFSYLSFQKDLILHQGIECRRAEGGSRSKNRPKGVWGRYYETALPPLVTLKPHPIKVLLSIS